MNLCARVGHGASCCRQCDSGQRKRILGLDLDSIGVDFIIAATVVRNALETCICTCAISDRVGCTTGSHSILVAAAALQCNTKHSKDEEESLHCSDLHAAAWMEISEAQRKEAELQDKCFTLSQKYRSFNVDN